LDGYTAASAGVTTTRSDLGVGGVGFGESTELLQVEGVGQADGDVEEAGDRHRFEQLRVASAAGPHSGEVVIGDGPFLASAMSFV
jgi:hypothetical protein